MVPSHKCHGGLPTSQLMVGLSGRKHWTMRASLVGTSVVVPVPVGGGAVGSKEYAGGGTQFTESREGSVGHMVQRGWDPGPISCEEKQRLARLSCVPAQCPFRSKW
jgi:hypothetical protein